MAIPPRPAPDFLAHLAACPACRGRHGAALRLLHGLPLLPRPTAPTGLSLRVTAAVLRDRRERRSRLRRWATVAAAAVLLLAPFLGLHWLRQLELPARPPLIVRSQPKPPPAPDDLVKHAPKPEPRTEPLRPQLEETRQAPAAVGDRLTKVNLQPQRLMYTATLPMGMAPLDSLTHLEPLNQPVAGAAQGVQNAGKGVGIGVQTVTGTTRRALSFFLRELPPLASPRKRSL